MKAKKRIGAVLPAILAVAAIFVIWQLWITIAGIPDWKVPSPGVVWKEIFTNFNSYTGDILYTCINIIAGFCIAAVVGIVVAALMSNFEFFSAMCMPILIFLSMVPMITIIPMLMLWISFGRSVKIIAIVLQAFPIIMMNSVVAFTKIDAARLELMQSLKASKWQTFIHCTLPNALPGVFSGLRLGAVLSTIAAVSAEICGGNEGLGVAVNNNVAFAKTIPGFACMMFIIVFGMIFYIVVSSIEKIAIKK